MLIPTLQMKKLRTRVVGPKTHSYEVMQLEMQPKLTGFRVLSHKHHALLLCPQEPTLEKKVVTYVTCLKKNTCLKKKL